MAGSLIEHLVQDAYASRRLAPWRFLLALALPGLAVVSGLLLGLSPDLGAEWPVAAVLSFLFLVTLLLIIPFLIARPLGYRKPVRVAIGVSGVLAGAALVVPPGDANLSSAGFSPWCLAGVVGCSILAFAMGRGVVLHFGSIADVRARVLVCGFSTLVGLAALYLHCPARFIGHVLTSHLLPALGLVVCGLLILKLDARRLEARWMRRNNL